MATIAPTVTQMRSDSLFGFDTILWWACLLVCGISTAIGQSRRSTEYEVKAAFIYEFGRFVEWAPTAAKEATPFTICVLGVDPFGIALDQAIKNKTTAGSGVVARRIVGIKDSRSCRILFISSSESSRIPEILDELEGASILTVGEGSQFTRRGGMISFSMEGNRVRFAVNTDAAERAGLKLSSQLLKLATNEKNALRDGL